MIFTPEMQDWLNIWRAGGMAQEIERLPDKNEALSSNPSTGKKKKKKKKIA
jgi:hypothetical protein